MSRTTRIERIWIIVAIGWMAGVGVASAAVAPTAKVGSEVVAGLAAARRVPVVVVFASSQLGTATARTLAVKRAQVALATDAVLAALPTGDYRLRRRFDNVAAVALEIDRAALDALRADPRVLRVDLDQPVHAHGMDEAGVLTHFPYVHDNGYIGSGVKVGVIDSGVQTNHGDLADSIVAEQCFCAGADGSAGCCPNGAETQSGWGSAEDAEGHGTNVTGIFTGNGTIAPLGGAPASDVVEVRTLDADGNGYMSDVAAALDWIASNHPDTRVINISIGSNDLFSGNCDATTSWNTALSQAVAAVVANGTLVTASSGNDGSPSQIASPACLAGVIAVGAVWDSAMSNQTFLGCTDTGIVADKPTCFTNSDAKVALYAPGAYTTSTGAAIDQWTVNGQSTYGGTSQAAPLVGACAATLFGLSPQPTAAQIKAALLDSDVTVVDTKNGSPFPRLDCQKALIDLDRLFADGYE